MSALCPGSVTWSGSGAIVTVIISSLVIVTAPPHVVGGSTSESCAAAGTPTVGDEAKSSEPGSSTRRRWRARPRTSLARSGHRYTMAIASQSVTVRIRDGHRFHETLALVRWPSLMRVRKTTDQPMRAPSRTIGLSDIVVMSPPPTCEVTDTSKVPMSFVDEQVVKTLRCR